MKHQLLAKNKAREDEKMLFKARWFLAICLWSMATDHWLMVADPLALGVIAPPKAVERGWRTSACD